MEKPISQMLDYGGVYLVRFDPAKGAEVGKQRPAVVLQSSVMLQAGVPTVLVCPLTSELRAGLEIIRVEIPPRDRLQKSSYAMVEHVRSIAVQRIVPDKLAQISRAEHRELRDKLLLVMGFVEG